MEKNAEVLKLQILGLRSQDISAVQMKLDEWCKNESCDTEIGGSKDVTGISDIIGQLGTEEVSEIIYLYRSGWMGVKVMQTPLPHLETHFLLIRSGYFATILPFYWRVRS